MMFIDSGVGVCVHQVKMWSPAVGGKLEGKEERLGDKKN
jgi:hypothetical protein